MNAVTLAMLLLVGCSSPSQIFKEDIGDSGMSCGSGSEEPLSSGFAGGLDPEGCRYTVAATDAKGTVQLLLDVPAFADAAAGNPVSVVYTLPDDVVRLEVDVGCGLSAGWCGDDEASGFVARTYTPTSGSVSVESTPDGDEADAVVVFTDVNLVDEYGETAIVDTTWGVRLYAAE
ncbi:MAG: hypothetical protein Q8P18_04845 [Pseudomonadota bacterium]|nr:hypothetical protein [Pseudomonadota bacterium]